MQQQHHAHHHHHHLHDHHHHHPGQSSDTRPKRLSCPCKHNQNKSPNKKAGDDQKSGKVGPDTSRLTSESLPILQRLRQLWTTTPTSSSSSSSSSIKPVIQSSPATISGGSNFDEIELLSSGPEHISATKQPRSYIPSPLGSPAAARRLGQRLGDRINRSPIVSRVKKRLKNDQDHATRFCGLLKLSSRCQDGLDETSCMWMLGDTGRIANRYRETMWDVWTTMGEDMWHNEDFGSSSSSEDDDDDDSSYDDSSESSSFDNDFVELPINDLSIRT